MKGKELRTKELKDNQLVFLEFDFGIITQCELDTELETELKRLREAYQDGVYKVKLEDKTFASVADDSIALGFNHNLISNIYEWAKCVCQELKNGEPKCIAKGDWNNLYLSKEDDKYYVEAIADGKASMQIKYCPFCGRKLGED